jgi:putative FmdB family regulatory protein
VPLFDYTCHTCQHSFEALVFGDEKVECPKCQGEDLEKLLSLPAAPLASVASLSSACGDPSLPPCGAPGCRRVGKS